MSSCAPLQLRRQEVMNDFRLAMFTYVQGTQITSNVYIESISLSTSSIEEREAYFSLSWLTNRTGML